MESTGSEVFGAVHQGPIHPARERPARAFGDLEPDRLPGFALDDAAAFLDLVGCVDIRAPEFHQVTAAEFGSSMARLKSARSRWFSASSSRTRMAQTCFGIS